MLEIRLRLLYGQGNRSCRWGIRNLAGRAALASRNLIRARSNRKEEPPKSARRFRWLVLVEWRFVHNRAAKPSGGFVRLSGFRKVGNGARLSRLRRRQFVGVGVEVGVGVGVGVEVGQVNWDSSGSAQEFVTNGLGPAYANLAGVWFRVRSLSTILAP